MTHDAQTWVEAITRGSAPFSVTLTEPAVFTQERVLHIQVSSAGWQRLHRQLVDTIIERSGAEPHPLERSGWTPHLTLFWLHPHASAPEAIAAARAHLPLVSFTADMVRLYQRQDEGERWQPVRDFRLGA